ncbi:hypothetical protein A6046_06200 [[Haemophilus] ducreyi]|uniref:DUF721 domain-containing protein n=2 Tax=Haemophilus ducreyi TaxID=730 RepID=Q7VKT1_HAEDU|nr:DciA family protein [[Haemophilus] ducreyi]AAP96541.1 hypothetical protein HD_1790 [[Haemophilus] ducreyi 35000HP]AKO31395.1 hypothetical protein RY60_06890 [[Haemophilus] ducreyi]AKO32847.1 hypothetical protein RZ57_06965 [[Haemophilus] ducreyi]AKO34295.1 hypothetical protein RZ58_06955 [[Haemophilus] ducreyi]AKO35738.1 hypothetical protein RZ59_06880 [[Haemophilus] ducreyi]
MKNNTIKNISDILESSSLSRIVLRANELNSIDKKLQHLLPTEYLGCYRLINLVNNQLVFEVQNATVYRSLQLNQLQLLKLIQCQFPDILQLKFKINPNFQSTK